MLRRACFDLDLIRLAVSLGGCQLPAHDQFEASDLEPVAVGESCTFDALAVDERPVGAVEIPYFQFAIRQCGQPAMNARHERRIDDEVRSGGTPDGTHASG